MSRGTKQYVAPGDKVLAVMPHSEVCMHMLVAGQVMGIEVIGGQYGPLAQLYDPNDGANFSFPILKGEAGIFTDDQGHYVYAETAGGCIAKGLPMGPRKKGQ